MHLPKKRHMHVNPKKRVMGLTCAKAAKRSVFSEGMLATGVGNLLSQYQYLASTSVILPVSEEAIKGNARP